MIAFSDEEGVRFQSTFLGSAAVAGMLDPGHLLGIVDKKCVSVSNFIQNIYTICIHAHIYTICIHAHTYIGSMHIAYSLYLWMDGLMHSLCVFADGWIDAKHACMHHSTHGSNASMHYARIYGWMDRSMHACMYVSMQHDL